MKRPVSLLLALLLTLPLSACAPDPEPTPTAATVLTQRSDSYTPGGEISFVARIDNKLLMGGGTNLRLCEFEGTSFSEAAQLDYSGGEIFSIHALNGAFHVLADADYEYSPGGELLRSSEELPYAPGDGFFAVMACDAGLVGSSIEGFKLLTDGSRLALDTTVGLSQAPTQGMAGELIIAGHNAFYEANLETGEVTMLHNHGGLNNVQSVCRLDESVFVYTLGGDNDLHIVSQAEESVDGRERVRVAILASEALWPDNTIDLSAGLVQMNASSDKYYYEYESFTRDRLIAEVSSKNAPDLVLFSNQGHFEAVDPYLNTDNDYFEDLYAYLDADSELSRDSFLPNLLNAIEVNGRLTQLWSYVWVESLAALSEDVEGYTDMCIADYEQIFEESGEYAYLLFPGYFNWDILNFMSTAAIADYVDKDSASCNFDSEDFSEIIAWCKELGVDTVEQLQERTAAIGDEDKFLLDRRPLTVPYLLEISMDVAGRDESGQFEFDVKMGESPYEFVGYPVGEGLGSYYSAYGTSFAIPTLGSNKAGAWEYIRTQLILETQLQPNAPTSEFSGLIEYNIPVNFEAMKQIMAATEEMSERDYNKIINLLNATTLARNYNDEPLREIIITSCEPYFAGDKTLEQTVSDIQNRARLYMLERYG